MASEALFARSEVRYLAVGGALFALDAAIFMTLVQLLSVELRVAQLISRTAGAAAGFVAHKYLTFHGGRAEQVRSVTVQGAGYLLVTVLNVLVSPFVVQAAYRLLPWSLLVAKVAADGVMLVESFLLLRWVFKSRTAS